VIYPRGWFVVAMSDEVLPGAHHDVRYFGGPIRLQRDDAGTACAEGFETRECNGCVLVGYPAGSTPDYEVPVLPEHDNAAWEPFSIERMRIATQSREIVENVADRAHFVPVHGTHFETFATAFDGHLATQRTTGGGSDKYPTSKFTTEATYHGPSFQVTRMHARGIGSVLLNAHTMVDEHALDLYFGVTIERTPRSQRFVNAYVDDIRTGFGQDVAIWEHKRWRDRPLLCDGDGPIMKLRKWYAQFYEDAEAPQGPGGRQ